MSTKNKASPEISPDGRNLAPKSAISGLLESSDAAIAASEWTCAVELKKLQLSKN